VARLRWNLVRPGKPQRAACGVLWAGEWAGLGRLRAGGLGAAGGGFAHADGSDEAGQAVTAR
jgi:hypothetical protein